MNYDFEIPSKRALIDSLDEEYQSKFDQDQIRSISIAGNSYSLEFCLSFGECLMKQQEITVSYLKRLQIQMTSLSLGKKTPFLNQYSQYLHKIFFKKIYKNLIYQITPWQLFKKAPNGALALKPYLERANSLQVFLINNCGLGIIGSSTISQALKLGTPNLQIWAMSRNRIEDQGAKQVKNQFQVAEALQNLRNLKELYIYQNFIRNEGMLEVFLSLKNCDKIEVIDVQDNYVKNETSDNLASLIKSSKTLKVLNLSDCNMEEEDNQKFIDAMKNSKIVLNKLGYNYNNLTSEQAIELFDIIKQNKNLLRLDIKGNEFRSKTKKYYKEGLMEAGIELSTLSKFESDSEDEDDLTKMFSNLQI